MVSKQDDGPQQYGSLIVVIGLPGSGKSTYMESLRAQNPSFSFFDDYQGGAYNGDPDPRLSKHFGLLVSKLKQHETVVVSDIRFCNPRELNLFMGVVLSAVPDITLTFKYFENAPELCKKNVEKRNREGYVEKELELIDSFSKNYVIPKIDSLPVYNSDDT